MTQILKKVPSNPIDGSNGGVLYFSPLAGDAVTRAPQVAKAGVPSSLRSAAYHTIRYDNDNGARTASALSCLGKPYNKVSYMLQNSKSALLGMLESLSRVDPSITSEKIMSTIRLLDGNHSTDEGDVLSRQEVARRFKMSVKAVDYHCRKGDFKRVRIGSSSRARGISLQSVMEATHIS